MSRFPKSRAWRTEITTSEILSKQSSPPKSTVMLFASGLRKAVDQADPNAAAILVTAEETARLLAEKRRRQMIRRHTCSTLKPELEEMKSVTFYTPPLAIKEDDSEILSSEEQPLPPSIPQVSSRPALDDWGTSGFSLPPPTTSVPPFTSGTGAGTSLFYEPYQMARITEP
ncbi:hypothetical protein NECAME_06739 [Necator americanus]|uniref:Uncharacterized protein n=1 Tax=Necator americanus TaxID=51031 RepID=W2TSR7_NECAM|nr:hypothetical protein NECAME_06739 [Necator americanus]ETN84709.1 hypothetical protein NECAME_06739 [Necator americanus]